MRQVCAVLVKLALKLVNDASQFAPLLNQPGDDMIAAGAHAALRCQ
jgi:hypothetical protein